MTKYSRQKQSPAPYGYVSTYQSRYQTPAEPPRHRSHKTLVFLVVLLLLVGTPYGVWSHDVSAHALAVKQAEAQAEAARSKRLAGLDGQLNQLLAANPQDTMSIAVQEVDTAHASSLRQDGVTSDFDAASTGKLITAADYLHQVENGEASLSQQIDGESASYWLRIMIVNSDDTAWATLNDYLTHPNLAAYASSIGLTNYNVDDNELSASDIALVLQKLYDKQLLNSTDTALLLSYMKQANYRDYIVPAVPVGDTVYHKVGIDNDTVNDAAIITHGSQTVVLVIFSDGNGTYDWTARAQLMQAITKDVTSAYFL